MDPISKNKIELIILGAILLIIVIFFRIPTVILNINNGNSTEVAPNSGDAGSTTLSIASFVVSLFALALAYRSLQITQVALKRTEIELQKREIEQRLELFYYPMSYYFKVARDNELKGAMNNNDRRVRVRAYSYRFKADKETMGKFEEWYKYVTNPVDNGKVIIEDDLVNYINTDIKICNNQIKDLDNQLQALATDYEIKATGAPKPWWRFW